MNHSIFSLIIGYFTLLVESFTFRQSNTFYRRFKLTPVELIYIQKIICANIRLLLGNIQLKNIILLSARYIIL